MKVETNITGIEKLRFNADDQQTKGLQVTNKDNSTVDAVTVKDSPVDKNHKNNRKLISVYLHPVTNKKPVGEYDIAYIYKVIISPYYKAFTEKAHSLKEGSKELREFKAKNFDYAMFGGTFTYGNAQGLKVLSGYLCIDIDHIPSKEKLEELFSELKADEELEVLLMFRSPSGHGIKAVVPVGATDAESHKKWFKALQNYMKQKHGVEIDKSCSDVCRACFLCYDPDAYIKSNLLNMVKND